MTKLSHHLPGDEKVFKNTQKHKKQCFFEKRCSFLENAPRNSVPLSAKHCFVCPFRDQNQAIPSKTRFATFLETEVAVALFTDMEGIDVLILMMS